MLALVLILYIIAILGSLTIGLAVAWHSEKIIDKITGEDDYGYILIAL